MDLMNIVPDPIVRRDVTQEDIDALSLPELVEFEKLRTMNKQLDTLQQIAAAHDEIQTDIHQLRILQEGILSELEDLNVTHFELTSETESIRLAHQTISEQTVLIRAIQDAMLERMSVRELGVYTRGVGYDHFSRAAMINALRVAGQLDSVLSELNDPTPVPDPEESQP